MNGRRGGSANARRRYASSSKAGPTRQNGLPSRDESAPTRAREPIVKASKRIRCLVGGHSWEQHDDPVGPLTFCSRCGKLQHAQPSRSSPEELRDPTRGAAAGGEGPH